MLEMIMGAVLGIGVAFFIVWGYRQGLSHGMSISKEKEPQPLIQKAPKKKGAEAQDYITKAFKTINSYSPYGENDGN